MRQCLCNGGVDIFAVCSPILLFMRRVYMSFLERSGWWCEFLEEDLKTPLAKKLAVANRDKILEMARRGGSHLNLEQEQALHHAFEIGRGGVWLNLTEEQYDRLKSK